MATCSVKLNGGYGPDQPATGGHMRIARINRGDNGEMVVTTGSKPVPVMYPFVSVPLEQGVEYSFTESWPGGITTYKLIPMTASADYSDLVDVIPVFADAGFLGDAFVTGLVENVESDTHDAILTMLGDVAGMTDETVADLITGDGPLTIAALDASVADKAPLASPAFTGTPTGITKAHVGLGSVDNTTDAAKLAAAAALIAAQSVTDDGKYATLTNVQLTGLVPAVTVADGTTNDRAAIAAADTAAVALGAGVLLRRGVHLVSTSLTITSPVQFQVGAILKPANGAVITLTGGIVNGPTRIFDMSLGGVVVPTAAAYHPAWWGPVGTTDDSATWNKMLTSASYLTARQVIHVPAGDNRLWQVVLNNVHLECFGRTRRILPPTTAVAGDPVVSDTGYVIKLVGNATINGGEFSTDGIAGITSVFWTGSRCWMAGSRVKPIGVGAVGIWAYVSGGSITPKISNMWVEGNGAATSGTGVRYESADGEMDGVTVAYCNVGIDLKRGSTVLNKAHIWECNTGISGIWAGNTRMTDCYIETNFGWGATFDNTNNLIVNKGTRFWKNGTVTANTGGLRIGGGTGTDKSKDCRIDAMFDDNVGTGLQLVDTLRTNGIVHFTSTEAIAGNAPLTVNGVVVDATSHGTDLTILAPSLSLQGSGYAPWTSKPFTNASQNSAFSLGGRSYDPVRGNNLVTDGDFSSVSFWTDVTSSTTLSTEQKYLGVRSMKLIGQSRTVWLLRTPWGAGNSTVGAMSVRPGQVFKLDLFAFRTTGNSATSGFYLSATFTDTTGVNAASTVDTFFAQTGLTAGGPWAARAATFTAPAGYNLVNFSFKTTGSVDPSDSFYIDAIRVAEIGNNDFFEATATLNFPAISAQSFQDLTIAVTGAVAGDAVALGVPTAAITAGVAFTGWVSATDVVTVRAHNYTAGSLDPASGVFKASIVR